MADTASVTFGQDLLGLSDLVVGSEGFSPYYIDKGGFGRPGLSWDEQFADDSFWIDGRLRTASKKAESSIPLTLRVQSESSSALDALIDALEACVSQFTYPLTTLVNGVSKTYRAYRAEMQTTDGLIAFERVMAFHEDFSILVPVYPNVVA